MTNLRAAQKNMTRRLLLESGLNAFESKGYTAATIDDIAVGAGTTRTTFYLHFSSKAQLMQALIEEVNELLVASDDPTLARVVASGDRQQIRVWITRKVDQWPEIRRYVVAAHAAAAADPEVAAAVEKWFESPIGDIHHGLDVADRFEPASRHIRGVLAFGQLEFLSRRWFLEGWDVDRDESLRVLTDAWCFLLVDGGAPTPSTTS